MNEIYLCDDEPSWLRRMEHTVSCFQVRSGWELSVVCRAQSPRELLSVLESRGTRFGIYFLDVEYKTEMNGLALGAEIRRLDKDAFLIYVTAHEDMALEIFRLKLLALDFIVKNSVDFQERIHQSLAYIEKKLACEDAGAEVLVLGSGYSYHFFPKKDIYFIESIKNSHHIALHTASGIHRYPVTLRECSAKLEKGFLLCRRGCLVNLLHIQSADRPTKTLLLDNGERCGCSIRQWDAFIRIYGRQNLYLDYTK